VRETEPAHHIPAAYLIAWARHGDICQMQRLPDRVELRHRRGNEIGAASDPITIPDVPADLADDFRARYAAAEAPDAQDILHHMIEQASWDAGAREAWIRFIVSLVLRSPRMVAQVEAGIRDILSAGEREMRNRYALKRSDAKAFAELVNRANPQAPLEAAARYLDDVMSGKAMAEALAKMRWARIPVPRARFSLLTSDNPLDIPLPLTDPNAYVALPLTSDTMFIASNNSGLIDSLAKQDHSKIVRMLNLASVSRAHDFVWSIDESQLAFVTNHFGSAPPAPLTSDQARQAALASFEKRAAG
jgi:hypothetical protein